MTKPKWTEGPWRAIRMAPEVKMGGHKQDWEILACDPAGKFGWCQNIGTVRVEQDACLIAAAPEMEEALKRIVTDHDERFKLYPETESQPVKLELMDEARAILAKIEGGR